MLDNLTMCPVKKVLETPYAFHDRENGESKLSTKVTLQYIRQLINLAFDAKNKGRGMKVARWSPKKLAEKKAGLV